MKMKDNDLLLRKEDKKKLKKAVINDVLKRKYQGMLLFESITVQELSNRMAEGVDVIKSLNKELWLRLMISRCCYAELIAEEFGTR